MGRIQASVRQRHSALGIWLSYIAAGMLVLMVVLQLFSYESTVEMLASLIPDTFAFSAPAITAIIVTLEVFSLPYLLPVAVSRLAWQCALVMSWLVPLLWITLMLMALSPVETTGLVPIFGATLAMDLGTGSVCIMLALLSVIATVTVSDYAPRQG